MFYILSVAEIAGNGLYVRYKELDQEFIDDEIVNLNTLATLKGYRIESWHKDIFKVCRSLGIRTLHLGVGLQNVTDEDMEVFCEHLPSLNDHVTESHFFAKIYRYDYFNCVDDQKNQTARIIKRLSTLKFVKRMCWKANYDPLPSGEVQDHLLLEIDFN